MTRIPEFTPEHSFEGADDPEKGQQTAPVEQGGPDSPSPEQILPDQGAIEVKPLVFEEVVSPEHLLMLSRASGGFYFAEDPSLPPHRTGYTNKLTKTIYYNPLLRTGDPKRGIKPWRAVDIRGFTAHEAGHHAPEVLRFDNKLVAELGNPDVIPEAYKGDPSSETRFFNALYRHLDNALVDIWLESFMSRRPYYPVRDSIADFQSAKGEMKSYRRLSMPEQLMQVVLRSRYMKQENLEKKLSRKVFEAYERIIKSKAIDVLMDRRAFENPFSAPADYDRTIERKMAAYRQVFLPEYLKLMEAELEKRKKRLKRKKKDENYEEPDENDEDEEDEEEENQEEQPEDQDEEEDEEDQEEDEEDEEEGLEAPPGQGKGKQKKGKKGKKSRQGPSQMTSGSGGGDESVPLTKEEEKEIIEQILGELEEAGKEFASQAPSEDDEKHRQSVMRAIEQALKNRQQQIAEGKTPEPTPSGESEGESGEEAIRRLGQEIRRQQAELNRQGLAGSMGVKQESVQHWERSKEKYRMEIESLAGSLAEVFLDDRRTKLEYLRREGEIVPGLEHETIAAMLSGELDPDTKMRTVKNPEFLETELEFIVDDSSSMSGAKIERSIELVVVITEALKRVRETIQDENLLADDDEQPFRIGVTKFTNVPERVTKLTVPISDKKELIIIDKLSQVGGGTDETEAIGGVYRELKLNKNNVVKVIVTLTDGVGNREGVAPIMRQIQEDQEVVFLVVGLGGDAEESQAIVDTYLTPLKDREANVFGIAAATPEQVLPQVVEFLKREVRKRQQVM